MAAREAFDTRLAQVKADLAARGLGGRLVDKAKHDAVELAGETIAVARESKGIIAGTVGALALWFLRDRIMRRARELFKPAKVQEAEGSDPSEDPSEEYPA